MFHPVTAGGLPRGLPQQATIRETSNAWRRRHHLRWLWPRRHRRRNRCGHGLPVPRQRVRSPRQRGEDHQFLSWLLIRLSEISHRKQSAAKTRVSGRSALAVRTRPARRRRCRCGVGRWGGNRREPTRPTSSISTPSRPSEAHQVAGVPGFSRPATSVASGMSSSRRIAKALRQAERAAIRSPLAASSRPRLSSARASQRR